jgi:hypothetical protein
VQRAARAFDAGSLQNRFALALSATDEQLPVPGASR